MEYAEIAAAAAGTAIVAWIADLVTGRRGYFAAILVAGVGALCGWFLAVRVFTLSTMNEWTWVVCALIGAALSLVAYYLFRNTR